ncbi:hypothetical protein Tco_0631416 [Tanacetum coccineum]
MFEEAGSSLERCSQEEATTEEEGMTQGVVTQMLNQLIATKELTEAHSQLPAVDSFWSPLSLKGKSSPHLKPVDFFSMKSRFAIAQGREQVVSKTPWEYNSGWESNYEATSQNHQTIRGRIRGTPTVTDNQAFAPTFKEGSRSPGIVLRANVLKLLRRTDNNGGVKGQARASDTKSTIDQRMVQADPLNSNGRGTLVIHCGLPAKIEAVKTLAYSELLPSEILQRLLPNGEGDGLSNRKIDEAEHDGK